MSVFATYFELGIRHILNAQATDHFTFLLALCAPYALADWRRVLALATSFTLGHSLTLALATLGVLPFNSGLVETLIPLTIVATALLNLRRAGQLPARRAPLLWAAPNALAAGFGLVHGLGFSSYLRGLLGPGRLPVRELLAFNLGVEAGQLVVVAAILGLGALVLGGRRVARRDWVLTTSGAALGAAVLLLVQLLAG